MATMATAWSGALASAWCIRVPRRGPMRASRAIRTGSVTFEANRFGSKPIIGTRSRTTAAAAKKKNKEDESESYTFDYEDDTDFDDADESGGWVEDGELSVEELNAINDARADTNADGTYFDSYAHIGIHREMIGDAARTGAYLAAIEAQADFLKGKVVLDVGCGTGILSMFCARAGARKVYAVDASGITRHAKRLVKENGFGDTIEVIKARMENVTTEDIPEKVDVIVSEWMGYALFFESMLPSVVDARDRFLAPGGLVLPNVAGTCCISQIPPPCCRLSARNYSRNITKD